MDQRCGLILRNGQYTHHPLKRCRKKQRKKKDQFEESIANSSGGTKLSKDWYEDEV